MGWTGHVACMLKKNRNKNCSSKTWMRYISSEMCVRAKDRTEMDLNETPKAKCLGQCSAPLRAAWPEDRVSNSSWVRDFSLHYRDHIGSEANTDPYQMGTGASFPTIKRSACCVLRSGEVMNVWSYTSTTFYIVMILCLIKYHDIKT
jgi:hypothetical protein